MVSIVVKVAAVVFGGMAAMWIMMPTIVSFSVTAAIIADLVRLPCRRTPRAPYESPDTPYTTTCTGD